MNKYKFLFVSVLFLHGMGMTACSNDDEKKEEAVDIIPYNDSVSIGTKNLKIYNPYKDIKSHQYTGQMHCHS